MPAATKQEIAVAIAAQFPELAPLVSPPRTAARNTADARMNVFDAVGMRVKFCAGGAAY